MTVIAIALTKSGLPGLSIFNACVIGARKEGFKVIEVNKYSNIQKCIKNCDIVLQICWINKKIIKSSKYKIRFDILNNAQKYNKNIIVLDASFTGHEGIYATGINGIKNYGNYIGKNMPYDRWSKLNIEIKPYRKDGDYILFLGQTRFGTSTQDIDVWEVYYKAILYLKEITNRQIIFRHHPRLVKLNKLLFPNKMKYENELNDLIYTKNTKLINDLKNAWAVVVYNTNAAVESLINGIPVFSLHDSCIIDQLCNHELKNINEPYFYEREQFFYDMAYWQWSKSELENGGFFNYIRNNLNAFCKQTLWKT